MASSLEIGVKLLKFLGHQSFYQLIASKSYFVTSEPPSKLDQSLVLDASYLQTSHCSRNNFNKGQIFQSVIYVSLIVAIFLFFSFSNFQLFQKQKEFDVFFLEKYVGCKNDGDRASLRSHKGALTFRITTLGIMTLGITMANMRHS